MSRLIVKGLTKNINEKNLFLFFSNYGFITDVKIFKKKNGTIKNYFFVGFSDKNLAKKVIQELNKTFINNQKMIVEEAMPKTNINMSNISKNIFRSTEIISETGLLFVRNIPFSCKIYELDTLFSKFGFLEFIKLPFKKIKTSFSTYAFIKFILPECAIKAAMILDGKVFQGRILHIVSSFKLFTNLCKNIKQSNFDKFKKIKLNLQYNNFLNHKSWFLLFVPEVAIFKCLFCKFGKTTNLISDYNHLKINTGKQILSEGRLQIEAFLILKKEGIHLRSFNPNQLIYRSNKIILIKNFSTYSRKNLDIFFANLGKIKKYIILKFTNLIIIEFEKKKYANFAYKILQKFKNTNRNVIFQWAPLNCLESQKYKKLLTNSNSATVNKLYLPWFKKEESNLNYLEKKKLNFGKIEPKKFKILIRNLPFSVSSSDLKNIFKNLDKIISIRIPKKKNGKNRGFGFVSFFTLDQAKKALVLIQNSHIKKRHLSCTLLS